MNYTNPGAISHNEIMELYKQYIDPDFSWANFTIEEQAKVIKAPRSNNLLDTARVRIVHNVAHLPRCALPSLFPMAIISSRCLLHISLGQECLLLPVTLEAGQGCCYRTF